MSSDEGETPTGGSKKHILGLVIRILIAVALVLVIVRLATMGSDVEETIPNMAFADCDPGTGTGNGTGATYTDTGPSSEALWEEYAGDAEFLTDDQVLVLIRETIDQNGDGRISYEEWMLTD